MDAAQLLGNTLSPDAAVRQDAEAQLETASKDNYPQYMTMLSNALQDTSIPTHIRSAAGLALKNALSAREASRLEAYSQRWVALDEASRTTVKSNVLNTLPSEDNRAGTAAAQVISAIASIELPMGLWNDLISNLLSAVGNAENAKLRMAALQAIGFTCESVPSHVLTAQSNEILTAVIQGARKEEPVSAVRLAALQALFNSLEFVSANFENAGERNYIMQIVCEATQTAVAADASREEKDALEGIKISSFECLVRIMNLYYEKMRPYVEQALFGLTVLGMRDTEPKVALQAIEFWSTVCETEIELAMEAEEAREYGDEPERISFNFARVALTELLPVLCDLLKIQDEDTDEDEWTVSKAAGTCITLLATVVTDEIVPLALPFIEVNIKDADWRSRDAAVMCFGSIMDGPRTESLAPLVEQALPTIIEMLRDPSVAVKDTAAWTLGRITDLLGETIKPDVHLEPLVTGLLHGLQDESRIITNCCWALMNLFAVHGGNGLGEEGEVEGTVASTSSMSRFFPTVIQSLMSISDRSNNDSNCRTSAYEALASSVSNCAADCLGQSSQVLLQVVERQEKLNGIISQLVGIDDSRNWADMQSNLCSVIMASVRRIGKDIEPFGDRLMTSLLTTMQQCQNAKMSSVLEDAFLAVGAIIAALEGGFEKYLGAFLPFMISALGNSAEHALCAIAVGLIGDVCRALGEQAKEYCEGFMNTLFQNLQNPDLDRAVKPPILSCFGDVALAIGANFERYLPTTMAVLGQAASIVAPQDVLDYEMIDYVNVLREGIAEAYTGIVAGLRAGNRADLLQAHVDSIFTFLTLVHSSQAERTELLIRSCLGLLGDLAVCYGTALKGPLSQSWVVDFVKAGRSRNNMSETRKVASWAREEIKKAAV